MFATIDETNNFREKLKEFSEKCNDEQIRTACGSGEDKKRERETERLLLEPFIEKILGCDIRSTTDVKTQYPVGVGRYQKEIDFVLLKEEKPIIAIECKAYGCRLGDYERGQLETYFQMLKSAGDTLTVGILTNGTLYEFYTDLEKDNVMDKEPFLCFDLGDVDAIEDSAIKWLMLLRKDSFEREKIVHELKKENSVRKFTRCIETLLREPSESFMSFLLKEEGFSSGKREVSRYTPAIKEACKAFLFRSVSRKSQGIEKPIMASEVRAPEREGLKLKEGRKKFSLSLADLVQNGCLRVGEVVEANYMGCKLDAKITEKGELRVLDGKEGAVSTVALHLMNLERKKLGLDILSNNPNGWDFWYIEREGQLVSLAQLRSEAESTVSTS